MQNFFKDKLSHPNTLDDLKYSCGRKENTFSFNINVIKTQTRTSKDERRMKEVTHWKDNDQLTGPTDDENEQSKQNRSNRIFLLLWPLKQTRRWTLKRYCRSQVQVSCFEWVSPFMAYEVFLREYEILLTHQGFGNISSRCNVLAVFLIGNTHSLLGWHFWRLLDRYKTASRSGTTEPQQS